MVTLLRRTKECEQKKTNTTKIYKKIKKLELITPEKQFETHHYITIPRRVF